MNSLKHLLPFMLAASLVGCATNSPIDWNSRVGHYTYADAVRDLGQPDRQIRLSNGSTEFKWFSQTVPATAAANSGFSAGGLNNPNPANNANWNGATTSHAFDRYLELTFDANGILASWSKGY